jgi:hypothetical protein
VSPAHIAILSSIEGAWHRMSLIALSTHSLVHQLGRCSYVFSLRLICPPLISVSVSLCSIHELKASPAHIARLAS